MSDTFTEVGLILAQVCVALAQLPIDQCETELHEVEQTLLKAEGSTFYANSPAGKMVDAELRLLTAAKRMLKCGERLAGLQSE